MFCLSWLWTLTCFIQSYFCHLLCNILFMWSIVAAWVIMSLTQINQWSNLWLVVSASFCESSMQEMITWYSLNHPQVKHQFTLGWSNHAVATPGLAWRHGFGDVALWRMGSGGSRNLTVQWWDRSNMIQHELIPYSIRLYDWKSSWLNDDENIH